jgi:hypothetical protein
MKKPFDVTRKRKEAEVKRHETSRVVRCVLASVGVVVLMLGSLRFDGNASSGQAGIDEHCACDCVKIMITEEGETPIDVPVFCFDRLCFIYMLYDRAIPAFGAGGLWPVYYTQTIMGDWIGGPSIGSIAGVRLSAGTGINGDSIPEAVSGGGIDSVQGTIAILDDSDVEVNPSVQWTVQWTWPTTEVFEEAEQHRVNRKLIVFICPN